MLSSFGLIPPKLSEISPPYEYLSNCYTLLPKQMAKIICQAFLSSLQQEIHGLPESLVYIITTIAIIC